MGFKENESIQFTSDKTRPVIKCFYGIDIGGDSITVGDVEVRATDNKKGVIITAGDIGYSFEINLNSMITHLKLKE